jgi:hypothetical protein
MGWDGIGTLLGKLSTFVPGRVEQMKNERERLLNERNILTSKQFSASGSRRIVAIDGRVQQIDNILRNTAKD